VKLTMGQEVWLLNPRAVKQKVARGKISGIGGMHKFYFQAIPDGWIKIDVQEALQPLMFPNDTAEQSKVGDILNSNGIWNLKFVKVVGA
jgi:hypothetical protein